MANEHYKVTFIEITLDGWQFKIIVFHRKLKIYRKRLWLR